MTTDEEIERLWYDMQDKDQTTKDIIRLWRTAEKTMPIYKGQHGLFWIEPKTDCVQMLIEEYGNAREEELTKDAQKIRTFINLIRAEARASALKSCKQHRNAVCEICGEKQDTSIDGHANLYCGSCFAKKTKHPTLVYTDEQVEKVAYSLYDYSSGEWNDDVSNREKDGLRDEARSLFQSLGQKSEEEVRNDERETVKAEEAFAKPAVDMFDKLIRNDIIASWLESEDAYLKLRAVSIIAISQETAKEVCKELAAKLRKGRD